MVICFSSSGSYFGGPRFKSQPGDQCCDCIYSSVTGEVLRGISPVRVGRLSIQACCATSEGSTYQLVTSPESSGANAIIQTVEGHP
jgi:hypothetical protein